MVSIEKRYEAAMMGQLNLLNQLYAVQAELAEKNGILAELNARLEKATEKNNNGEQNGVCNGTTEPVRIDNESVVDGKTETSG